MHPYRDAEVSAPPRLQRLSWWQRWKCRHGFHDSERLGEKIGARGRGTDWNQIGEPIGTFTWTYYQTRCRRCGQEGEEQGVVYDEEEKR